LTFYDVVIGQHTGDNINV